MAASATISARTAPPRAGVDGGVLVTLLPAAYVARLTAALPHGARIHRLERCEYLCQAPALLPDAIVVDPLMCCGTADLDRVLRPIAAASPLIVYTSVSPAAMHRLLDIPALAGARLVLAGVDDGPASLRETVRAVRTTAHSRRALEELRTRAGPLPPDVSDAIAKLLAPGSGPLSVIALARAARLSTRTLQRRLTEAHGPSPIWLIRTARALLARELLCSSVLTIDEVARRVGYAKPHSLRTLIRWSFDASPSTLRTAKLERPG